MEGFTRRRALLTGASVATTVLTGGCATTSEPNADKEHPSEPKLLEPRSVPWPLRMLDPAQARISYERDGRLRFSLEHEVLKGVTPAMLVWWFNNIEGSMVVGGRELPRYHVWHPVDHIDFWTTGRTDGKVGPGTRFHIVEAFGGNPAFMVNEESMVERLDETGFAHGPRRLGLKIAHLEYSFTPTDDGTLYKNFLLVGPAPRSATNSILNAVRPWVFSEARGRAWLKHNVEEVGLLENFLPKLYRDENP